MKKISPISYKPRDISFSTVEQYLSKSFTSNHITNWGPCVTQLENLVRKKLQILPNKAVICTSSGTAALHALIAGITKYNKKKLCFATQSYTFPSSIQQILSDSIIVDIDCSGGLDLSKVKHNNEIDGIIVTNCFGNLVDIGKYQDWCNKNNKILIFDNASTPSSFWKGSNSVNFGNGAIISLHHTKPIGFGEGGVIIANSIYEKNIRECVDQGFGRPDKIPIPFHLGSNYKMSDISAAFILSYFKKYDVIRETHMYFYQKLKSVIKGFTGIDYFPSAISDPFCSSFALLVENGIEETYFHENGVLAKKYYLPLSTNTPIANRFYKNIICLPLHIDLKKEDLHLYTMLISNISKRK